MLYVVPTPIGNLEDITLRALNTLRMVDKIWAEDTRTSRRLLEHYEIKTPLASYHAFNEHQITAHIVEQIKNGATFALISDAGTPAISDPGFMLVRACRQAGLKVECLPGPTALIPALVASGLPADRFHFEGFLPHKKGRKTRLLYLATLPNTFILYESPKRLIRCLEELVAVCGSDRPACIARELTKIHEEIHSDTLGNLLTCYKSKPSIKGEIVIVIAGTA